jgi:hypothetical protein
MRLVYGSMPLLELMKLDNGVEHHWDEDQSTVRLYGEQHLDHVQHLNHIKLRIMLLPISKIQNMQPYLHSLGQDDTT